MDRSFEVLCGMCSFTVERPCAFMIGAQSQDTQHGKLSGVRPHFLPYSPVPCFNVGIEEAFVPNEAADTQIDMGSGDDRYKTSDCNHVCRLKANRIGPTPFTSQT